MASFLNSSLLEAAADLWEKGGWVIYPIYALGFAGWLFFCIKFVELWIWSGDLRSYQKNRGKPLKARSIFGQATNELLLKAGPKGHAEVHQWEAEIQLTHLSSTYLESIGRIAAVSPLVGLLGTVAGLISTFEVLHMNTFVNAAQLSAGVSEALVATQAGLLTAFPLMLAHQHVCTWSERLEQWSRAEWTRLREKPTEETPL